MNLKIFTLSRLAVLILLTMELLILSSFCYAQKKVDIFTCGFSSKSKALDLNNFISDEYFTSEENLDNLIEKILNIVGLKKNFVVVSYPNLENAYAITAKDGIRYIVYDKSFLNKINNSTTNWSTLSILAHEIGHHLSGHTLTLSKNLREQKEKEIEADEFSGFIMYKLGASILQAEYAINLFATNYDDTYSTHPSLNKRKKGIEVGYEKAKRQDNYFRIDTTKSVEEYCNEGLILISQKQFFDAILSFDKAIKINPSYYKAYHDRGFCKSQINDSYNSISDYSAALKINPNYERSYTNRSAEKSKLSDFLGAIADCDQALLINPKSALAYCNRGWIKFQLKNYKEAIKDYDKAVKFDSKFATAFQNRSSCYYMLGKYKHVISDCNKALQIDNYMAKAYFNRGSALGQLAKKNEACNDIQISCHLGLEDGCNAFKKFCQ